MDNSADFGLTQLPVDEKRLQVVDVHRDEIRLLVPAGHRAGGRASVLPAEVAAYYLLLPKTGKTRARLDQWLEPMEDESARFDGAGFHRDDEALRYGRPWVELHRHVQLPGRDCGR